MKNKKGFTLIELLAVIVILAVIALIATPAIINIIENARKKAFEDTSYGVLEGLRLDYVERTAQGVAAEEKTFEFPNSGLELSGEEPAYGEAKIDSKGNISFALADKDKKWCTKKDATSEKVYVEEYNEKKCKIDGTSDGATLVPPTSEDTHKGIVYLDPADLTKECNEGNSVSDTGTKTGCMKWYIYDDEGETYKMLLDHNTTATVAWNSSNTNSEMKEVKVALETDTEGWTGSPRLITADEIAKITGNSSFNSSTATISDNFYFETNTSSADSKNEPGTNNYAWLFDRTFYCKLDGCNVEDNSNLGYWTSTSVSDSLIHVWGVGTNGSIYGTYPTKGCGRGLRPVITASKSLFS